MASTGGNASGGKFSLKIENEIIKCMDTGSSITPDASAFKSFAVCHKGGGGANSAAAAAADEEEESDFLLFVVNSAFSGDRISGGEISDDERNGGGIDMVWVDSQSSSGYRKKSLMGGDARLAGQRAVHVEATQGADGKPVLVAVLARAIPTNDAPQRLTVWVCTRLSASNDDSADEPSWTPCGFFDGKEVKSTSATTISAGDYLVVLEGTDSTGKARVYYGDSAEGGGETPLATFPKPEDMTTDIGQVKLVHDRALEQRKAGEMSAVGLTLPTPPAGATAIGKGSSMFVQALPDPSVYEGSIQVPGDARCFATTEGSSDVDLYVAGTTKAFWYGLKAWGSTSDSPAARRDFNPERREQINEVDFESPAKKVVALVDSLRTKHIWILLENGDLMYTFDTLGDDEAFLEPVNILPSTKDFGCHIDAVGNIHVLGVNDDGQMVHHMKDEGTSLWMQKEILVPGGDAEMHLMSVVEVTVKSSGKTAKDVLAIRELPPVFISTASAAFFRVNGKGHIMHSDKVIEVKPDGNGVVRVMQFVDSFIIPRVMISMPGMDRPLEVLCNKVLQHRLKDVDGDALRNAKLPDAMGNEGASLITDPEVAPDADEVADTLKGLLETFEGFESEDFVKKNDVSGNFRLGGTSLSDANQFVVWGDADDLPDQAGGAGGGAGDFSPDGPFDMPILVAGPGLGGGNDQQGTGANNGEIENIFTGDMPILVAGEGFGGGGTDASGNNIGSGDIFTGNFPVLVAGSRAAATNVSSTSRALPGAADVTGASSADTVVVRKKAKKRLGRFNVQGRPARRFNKLRVVSREKKDPKKGKDPKKDKDDKKEKAEKKETAKSKKLHFSFARKAGKASGGKANGARPGMSKIGGFASVTAQPIRIKHQDAGDIAKTTKAAGDKLDLQAKYKAAENVRVANEFAEEACARAWADAAAAQKAAEETIALVKQALEEEAAGGGDDSTPAKDDADAGGQDRPRSAPAFTSRGIGGRIKRAARKAREAAQRAARAAQNAAKKAADAAKAAAAEAAKAAEQAAKEADRIAKAAAEAAKEAAAAAAQAAADAAEAAKDLGEDVIDGVGDVIDEVGDTVGDVADTLGDIADKIGDAVGDAANVVQSITMEVIDVIEEVVEEVQELGPDGILRLVVKVVGTVAKKAIKIVVDVAGKVFEFLADIVEKAVAALNWVWNKIKVGIRAALEWLMSFFALFEIIKTAELLEDTVVKGLTSLADNIPTEEDVKKMFDSVRSSVGKLTGLDLDSTELPDDSDSPDQDPKASFASYHASNGSFDASTGDAPIEGGQDVDEASTEQESQLETVQTLSGQATGGGGLNGVVSDLVSVLMDLVEAGAAGVLKSAKRAVELLRDWIDGGGKIYIPVISEMFKLATGKDLLLGKAVFFLLAIPITYGLKLSTGKFPSELFDFDLLEGEGEPTERETDNLNDMVLGFKGATVYCDQVAITLTVVTLGKAKELPLLSKLQKVYVALTQVFKAQSIVTKQRVNLIQDNTDRLALSSVRYSMATAVMLWQAPVLGFGAPKTKITNTILKLADATTNFVFGILTTISAFDEKGTDAAAKLLQGFQLMFAGAAAGSLAISVFPATPSPDVVLACGLLKTGSNIMGLAIGLAFKDEVDIFGIGV